MSVTRRGVEGGFGERLIECFHQVTTFSNDSRTWQAELRPPCPPMPTGSHRPSLQAMDKLTIHIVKHVWACPPDISHLAVVTKLKLPVSLKL